MAGKRKYSQVRKTQHDNFNRLVWEWFVLLVLKGYQYPDG